MHARQLIALRAKINMALSFFLLHVRQGKDSYIYIYIYIYIYTSLYVCKYLYTHNLSIHKCFCTHEYDTLIFLWLVCQGVYVFIHICVCVCLCLLHVCACTYTSVHIYIHVYIHVSRQKSICALLSFAVCTPRHVCMYDVSMYVCMYTFIHTIRTKTNQGNVDNVFPVVNVDTVFPLLHPSREFLTM